MTKPHGQQLSVFAYYLFICVTKLERVADRLTSLSTRTTLHRHHKIGYLLATARRTGPTMSPAIRLKTFDIISPAGYYFLFFVSAWTRCSRTHLKYYLLPLVNDATLLHIYLSPLNSSHSSLRTVNGRTLCCRFNEHVVHY